MSATAIVQPGRNKKRQPHRLQLLLPGPAHRQAFPRLRIAVAQRRGPVLRPNPIAGGGEEVLGLNLVSGCPHQCSFCFAQAYPGDVDPDAVYLFADLAEQLRIELRQRRKLPRAVYLCPSTDPFPPFAEVQAETARVIEALAEFDVDAWIMTRGFIRPFAAEVLVRHQKHVRVTMAITTLNRDLSRVLEPFAAPPRMRLKQIARFVQMGLPTQAAIDPLFPALTDTQDSLVPLLDALAETGVERLSAGYLFLRRGIRANLLKELGSLGWVEPILERYAEGPVQPLGTAAPAQLLPRHDRQRGYARLTALASERGMTVSLSRVTNPDFRPAEPEPDARRPRQMSLYN